MLDKIEQAIGTKKLYLVDFKSHGKAKIVEIIEGDKPILRLEDTYFHPQGGGQKADKGTIGPANILHVSNNGKTVDHFVDSTMGFEVGSTYMYNVDIQWRKINSVYHSAGHLIASIVEIAWPSLNAISGHQWPGEARVEFGSKLKDGAMPALIEIENLQEEINKQLKAALKVKVVGNPFTAREVQIGEYKSIPCGGTHVDSLADISEIRITNIKSKAGKVRVSYEAIPS